MSAPHDLVSRVVKEINSGWAMANPELFTKSVWEFQHDHPITHWQHFIDMSRYHYLHLIAVRRDEPFDSTTDYVMADDSKLYLRETGYEG